MSQEETSHGIPKSQSRSEIRGLLTKHLQHGTPCEVTFDQDDETCAALHFVVSLHPEFVMLARIYQVSWLNGWKALRLDSVLHVNPSDDADFILRAMQANRVPLPLPPPVRCATFLDFLRSVCDTFPIVTTSDDPALIHPSAAGTILDVTDNVMTIRSMSTKGYWDSEPHTIDLKHVSYVLFGSEYEQTLERIAALGDAGGE